MGYIFCRPDSTTASLNVADWNHNSVVSKRNKRQKKVWTTNKRKSNNNPSEAATKQKRGTTSYDEWCQRSGGSPTNNWGSVVCLITSATSSVPFHHQERKSNKDSQMHKAHSSQFLWWRRNEKCTLDCVVVVDRNTTIYTITLGSCADFHSNSTPDRSMIIKFHLFSYDNTLRRLCGAPGSASHVENNGWERENFGCFGTLN